MSSAGDGGLAFSFRATKGDQVMIYRDGAAVTTLRGSAARDFLARVTAASPAVQQQVMARATGNYKRGNEQRAAGHPRNRGALKPPD